MNKKYGAVYNFGVTKFRTEGVCDTPIGDLSNLKPTELSQDVQRTGNCLHTEEKVYIHTQVEGGIFPVWFHTGS
jgi:hypothetical protein